MAAELLLQENQLYSRNRRSSQTSIPAYLCCDKTTPKRPQSFECSAECTRSRRMTGTQTCSSCIPIVLNERPIKSVNLSNIRVSASEWGGKGNGIMVRSPIAVTIKVIIKMAPSVYWPKFPPTFHIVYDRNKPRMK